MLGDYFVFLVIDIIIILYKLVVKYRNNDIKLILFLNIIVDVVRNYNYVFVLVEVNDVGG